MTAGSYKLSFKIRRLIMNLPKSLLLYTDFEKKLYKRDHVFALNNGLCSSNINLAKLESKNIAEIEVKNNFVNLIYIGRLTHKSNIASLMKAIKLSKTKFNLIVIGSGPEESNLKALSEKIGVKDKITFVGEVYDEKKIAAYMLKSKAFIYPGSVGLSLIHAFNYGLPAIIHDDRNNHMPEYAAFTNNYNGIAFKRNSISSLASTIDKFILLPELEKNQLSQNALETIKKSFNVNDMFLRFSQCIESTIK
jgi:glycosyltransferase involved in cell wall biosynthesis